MKSSISTLFFIFSLYAQAQIAFEAQGEKMDSINTPNGQNYLVLNPADGAFAFTEERGGSGDQLEIVELNGLLKVFRFTDWLGIKGMTSPIGFFDGYLYYGATSFDKGVYSGKVMRMNLKSGNHNEVTIPFLKNKGPIQSGCISRDGQVMILSLESNNTYGVEDLYFVKRKPDGSWDRAKNMGAQLNTKFQEITPFLAEDNKTLFFATNRGEGEGSFDLFYAVRQDESWRSWSEPVNLGSQINTTGSETSFAYRDGSDWAYYVSSQDSDGYGDIMKIRFREDIEEDTAEVAEAVVVETPVEASNTVILKVVDDKTKVSLPATLIVGENNRFSSNGIFEIDTLDGQEVEIKSRGFLPKVIALDKQLEVGENEIGLSSVAKGSVITLDHVLFQRGTANMVEGSEKELNLVVEVMNDNPKIKILLKGHTDNTGDPVKNVQLSEARVKTVKEYIIDQGISPYRVTGRGYGGNQPLYSNETEETRKLNRRVEFEVVED